MGALASNQLDQCDQRHVGSGRHPSRLEPRQPRGDHRLLLVEHGRSDRVRPRGRVRQRPGGVALLRKRHLGCRRDGLESKRLVDHEVDCGECRRSRRIGSTGFNRRHETATRFEQCRRGHLQRFQEWGGYTGHQDRDVDETDLQPQVRVLRCLVPATRRRLVPATGRRAVLLQEDR